MHGSTPAAAAALVHPLLTYPHGDPFTTPFSILNDKRSLRNKMEQVKSTFTTWATTWKKKNIK